MKLTMRTLESLDACDEAKEAFQNQKERDIFKLFDLMLKAEKYDWANWLIARLLDRDNKIRYAIFAAERRIEEFEKKYPDDKRPREAIKAAKAVLKRRNQKTIDAAWSARSAAESARSAARSAAESAEYRIIIGYGIKLLKKQLAKK